MFLMPYTNLVLGLDHGTAKILLLKQRKYHENWRKKGKMWKRKKREKGGKRGLGRERKTEENERKILFQIKICVYLN
jgi:hypothetical protein